ncbi:glyoxalase [Kiloniella litopenaei]|uniref:Glyoxalase n=1 Tax=Kiloniella litopenaei TaxID=1549748 RepID=A0A0M2R9F2_9PROT|nr:glyoxalase [Kiloniella litopenaei]KKJ76193.1 glyoxalase [Kiloniella litopenaei]
MQLDHVTIRTRNLAVTRDFFISLFDLEEHDRPQTIKRIPGHWLYSNDQPIVHLIGSQGHGIDCAAEAFDHVAFRLHDYQKFKEKLHTLGIRYSCMDLPEIKERRLFFRTPCGPLLEAVFAAAASDFTDHAPDEKRPHKEQG